ncbi:MAG TPA: NADH-quinone oxidoreductase subunit N [Stellaceae bacterium]|nr:NADH-quinone oxidoreductase subunit N [Stellaceae bacterium]
MSGVDPIALLPYLVLAAAIVAALLAIAVRRDHRLSAGLCAVGLVVAWATIPVAALHTPRQVTPLFVIDSYALFYLGLVVASALAVALLSYAYFAARNDEPREEYYVLLLLATLGAGAIVASTHFAGFFLGLETLSISLLGLIAYPRRGERPLEAGIKYLILSGVSSAFLVFGIALVYTQFGTMVFAATGPFAGHPAGLSDLYWLAGLAMILTGIGFKLSLVPFHLWAPDIYEGAPAPVTAFVAVVSKSAVFALLLRYFLAAGAFNAPSVTLVLSIIAVLSILVGNLLALLQDNVKRILAYSSIAHLGYLLVAFLAGGALAILAVSIYLVAYAITTLGAFGVVALLSRPGAARDADRIADYRGLLWTRRWLAVTFIIMLLSLAGIPVTLGFIAKFFAVTSGVGASLLAPLGALVLGSVIGLYYYLRVIVAMVLPLPEAAEPPPRAAAPVLGGAVMAALLLLLIGFGLYPAPLLSIIRGSAVTLAAAPHAAARVAVGLGR